ncbi:MAG: acyl carrier protein [Planctomycetota bacterium]
MTRDEIFEKVQAAVEDALGVDADEITEEARLTADLGAESIDFLDITFKHEQEFGFKIQQGELFPDAGAQDPDMVQDGKLTPKAIESLESRLPDLSLVEFKQDPKVTKLADQFTVGVLVGFVERKLASEAPATA